MNFKVEKIINTNEFVKEPVKDVCDKLNRKNDKVIILGGKRGSGKTIVLSYNEIKNINKKNKVIYTRFDSIGKFDINEFFDFKFLEHYHEIEMSFMLLNHIKKYYPKIYETHFKYYEKILANIIEKTDEYIKNIYFENVLMDKYLSSLEISLEIIKTFKKVSKTDSITLEIDRFDWTNGNKKESQQIISNYFKLFDKNIIAVDARYLMLSKPYTSFDITYGKDFKVVREIIDRKIETYILKNNIFVDKKIITDEMLEEIIINSNNNINLILDIVDKIISSYQWYGKINLEMVKQIISEKISEIKELNKRSKRLVLYI